MIETQRGRFVYKPRDCGIDRELRELVGRVMPDCLGIPKCLVREGYGWCEYIEPGEVSSAAEVGRFYRRFGSACALMQALGGSDLHSSNWICSGGLPVLVDVETALSPVPRVFSDKRMFPELMAESESFLRDANRSLIPSSLLPSRLAGRELSVLLDDSGSSGCEPVLGGKGARSWASRPSSSPAFLRATTGAWRGAMSCCAVWRASPASRSGGC